MKLTEVSTNSQDIFPFYCPWEAGGEGGFTLQSLRLAPHWCVGGGRLIGLLLLGDPALPSRTCILHACMCACLKCGQALTDAYNFAFVCPSGLLSLTGESDREVYEEVSAVLGQGCCYRSQSGSPGSQASVSVLEVGFQPVRWALFEA